MAEPRKIFRIEHTTAARLPRRVNAMSAAPHHPRPPTPAGTTGVAAPAPAAADAIGTREDGATPAVDLARIARELDAVTGSTAQAAQRILAAAEEIEQHADNLSAALKGRIEQDLAQDISDHVLRIFEACDFQDLIAQRIGNVMKTLASAPPSPADDDAAPSLHGPRLDHDEGHVTQAEIDAMFDF